MAEMKVRKLDVEIPVTTGRGVSMSLSGRSTGRGDSAAGSVYPYSVEIEVGGKKFWVRSDDVFGTNGGPIADW